MADSTMRLLSFVIPVKNEEKNLAAAVESVLNQKLPAKTKIEIIIALASSDDGSSDIATALAKKYKSIKVIDNPSGITSAGLNLGIKKAGGDIVFRVDGHSALSPGYVQAALSALDGNEKIGNVGGIMKAEGTTDFEKAVAWAYSSKFGLGGGNFHTGGKPGPAQSVYLGVFRKSALEEVGLFDESVIRGQDWELNQRLAKAGWIVWFDPKMVARYQPRGSWRSLAEQFFKTGKWRGVLSRSDFPNISIRYLMPPLLVLSTLLWFPLWAYLIVVALIAATTTIESMARFHLFYVLPTIHYSWGVGFLVGLFTKRASGKAQS